jgi:hypothetical protein
MESMIIENGQVIAKWRNDMERRLLAEMYLDFYRGVYRNYLEEMIKGMMGWQDAKELCKFIETEGTTPRLINDISLIFAEDADITIDGSEKTQEAFSEVLEDIDINIVLENLNKYVELLRDVAVVPFLTGDDKTPVKLKIITPEKCFVEQDENDPTNFTRFYYQVGVSENTASRNRIDLYDCWEAPNVIGYDGNAVNYARKFNCEVNSDGTVLDDTVVYYEDAPKFEEMPVVMFRDYLPDDSVWYKGGSFIVDKSIAIDLRRTDLAMAEAYNIPQLVTIGMEAENHKELKKGRSLFLNIPPSMNGDLGDAKYVNPEEALKELKDLIHDRYEKLAMAKGISKANITGDSATSGYQLALSMQRILDINRRKRKYYTKPIKKMLRLVLFLYKDKYNISGDITINYGELHFSESEIDKERAWGLKLSNGTANLVDYELEHDPDLVTREEALEKIKQRQAENARLQPDELTAALAEEE